MKLKKVMALTMAGAMAATTLTACGSSSSTTETTKAAETTAAAAADTTAAAAADNGSSDAETVLQVAFENSISEPVGQGWEKAQEIIKEKSGGKMAIEIYPDSQLGDKSSLIDSMLLGENVCTLADGAFYADYGVPDFGIVFGPFLFDSWDQVWKLVDSDWYKEQCGKLEEKGLKIIASNWIYGERHTLTNVPVNTVDDLKGLKIRVPSNEIQSKGFDVLGATSTGMALGDVYQALQTKTIDGAENPLATLYGRKLHEVAKYLILDGHVKNFTTWVVSADWFNSLPEEQQTWLLETAEEAGEYNNEVQQAADAEYLQKMKDEGVTVVEPSEEVLAGFKEKAQPFYEVGAVLDTKNKVKDKANAVKENIKDIPTQTAYAVYSAKEKAKSSVSDFKRGMVQEQQSRQTGRLEKQEQHRQNIADKRMELQKAQEARQAQRKADGSATTGATRPHERPATASKPSAEKMQEVKRPATATTSKASEPVKTNVVKERPLSSGASDRKATQPTQIVHRQNVEKVVSQETRQNYTKDRRTKVQQTQSVQKNQQTTEKSRNLVTKKGQKKK